MLWLVIYILFICGLFVFCWPNIILLGLFFDFETSRFEGVLLAVWREVFVLRTTSGRVKFELIYLHLGSS